MYVPLKAPMAEATLHKLYPWNYKITEYSELERDPQESLSRTPK